METCMTIMAMLWGLPGILAVCLLLALVFFAWPRTARAEEKTPAPAAGITTNAIKGLSRAEIQQKLRKLAETPPPTKLKHGAACYDMAVPPKRAEYVCPKCGEKTLYTNQMAQVADRDLDRARWNFKSLQQAVNENIALDESQFCRKCSPEVKDPKLVLKIAFADGKPQSVVGVTPDDLLLLTEFFSGKLAHDAGMAGEKPLKDYSKRLRELLGVEAK
jgi:hypothetical protein